MREYSRNLGQFGSCISKSQYHKWWQRVNCGWLLLVWQQADLFKRVRGGYYCEWEMEWENEYLAGKIFSTSLNSFLDYRLLPLARCDLFLKSPHNFVERSMMHPGS